MHGVTPKRKRVPEIRHEIFINTTNFAKGFAEYKYTNKSLLVTPKSKDLHTLCREVAKFVSRPEVVEMLDSKLPMWFELEVVVGDNSYKKFHKRRRYSCRAPWAAQIMFIILYRMIKLYRNFYLINKFHDFRINKHTGPTEMLVMKAGFLPDGNTVKERVTEDAIEAVLKAGA